MPLRASSHPGNPNCPSCSALACYSCWPGLSPWGESWKRTRVARTAALTRYRYATQPTIEGHRRWQLNTHGQADVHPLHYRSSIALPVATWRHVSVLFVQRYECTDTVERSVCGNLCNLQWLWIDPYVTVNATNLVLLVHIHAAENWVITG